MKITKEDIKGMLTILIVTLSVVIVIASSIVVFDELIYDTKDLVYIKQIIMSRIEPTEKQMYKYDLNDDGVITSADYMILKKRID